MERLIEPVFFGANALEILVLALVGIVAWRIWRRMSQGR